MRIAPLLAGTFIVSASQAFAISITPTTDASALAQTLFLNQPELIIQDVELFSSALDPLAEDFGDQAGTYTNLAGTYGLPNAGIVLSSGNVTDYETGPNTDEGFTTGYNIAATAAQEALLQPITGIEQHFDPVQLDIDFFVNADIDTVTFFAAFGSEEFPEFQFSGVTDGFGLYVNGTNVAGAVPTGGGAPQAINIDHPDMIAFPGTELDGMLAPNGNPVLRFDVPVNAGETNEFSIIISDAGDEVLDTTVYLSSFFSEGGGGDPGDTEFNPVLPSNPPDPETGEFIIELPEVPEGQTVWIDPPVSVGFVYDAGVNEFASATAPSLATVGDLDGYFITAGGTTVGIAAGETIDFLSVFGDTFSTFELTGIDPALMLDPSDPLAFPLGVTFTTTLAAGQTVSMTPLTEDIGGPAPIPLPAAGLLYAFGAFGCLAMVRRRRKSAT